MEPRAVDDLLAKIPERGEPLTEFAGVNRFTGIKTGFNEAFLDRHAARENRSVATDPGRAEVIQPYLRGQDIERWHRRVGRSLDDRHEVERRPSLAVVGHGRQAEDIFRETYPGYSRTSKPLEEALRKRRIRAVFWWELRSCAYWGEFEKPKLIYQDITWSTASCLDSCRQH